MGSQASALYPRSWNRSSTHLNHRALISSARETFRWHLFSYPLRVHIGCQMIEVQTLKKGFGSIQAVADVSFTAKRGRVTGLLGPNGAGKSTTLRMIYGLLRPDQGEVNIDGVNIHNAPLEAKSLLGVLPDGHGLYARLTAREHILYFGELHGLDRDTRETRAQALIDRLDMQSIADRRVEGFSQGERMKVCLGRALVHAPSNIVLDEPTNGLDVASTRKVREMINLLRDEGLTVLFSSHLMHEVARLCDDIIIINEGRVIAEGTPDEIRAQGQSDQLEDAFLNLLEAPL